MSLSKFLKPQQITTDVLLEKYAKAGETTAEDIFKRVSLGVAQAELGDEAVNYWADKFYTNMLTGAVGAGRIMSAAGSGIQATLANCFVIPVGDCIRGLDKNGLPGIYVALEEAAETMRRGGGVGYNFSAIRPRNAYVKGTHSFASGPCSYMNVFNESCATVESAGCFAGDALIHTTVGLIPIKDIVESDKDFYAVTHLGPKKIIAKFNNGKKEVWNVHTKYGNIVPVTMAHKFGHFDSGCINTTAIEDLIANGNTDVLISIPETDIGNITNEVSKWTKEQCEAYLVGAFHGNGSWCWNDDDTKVKGIRISNSTTKSRISEKIVRVIKSLGLDAKETKVVNENTLIVSSYSVDFYNDWKDNKKVGKDPFMTVPKFILESTPDIWSSYIAGIFEADGCISETKSNYRLRITNKELLQQIQIMLNCIGIPNMLSTEREEINNWKTIYLIGIYGPTAQQRFNNTVGRFMNKILKQISCRERKGFGHKWKHVKQYGIASSILKDYWSGSENNQPKVSLNALINKAPVLDLINTVSDSIDKIELRGTEDVYDLEVEDVHMLSGNGIYTSNSRRGAQMGILDISHPDVMEFITAKRTPGRWNNFNVSVFVSDKFIEAKDKSALWELTHAAEPSEKLKDNGAYYNSDAKVWVYSIVDANELWDAIMKSNYDYAEPGILFEDNINKDNNLRYVEQIKSTNPCVTGDTVILTSEGYKRIDSLINTSVNIWNGFEWSEVVPRITGTNQEIFDLEFSDGTKLPCTPYHQFILDDGSRIEAKDLNFNHKLAKFNFPVIEGKYSIDKKTAYTQGFYSGDGQIGTNRIWLYNEKTNLIPYLSLSSYSDQSNDQQYRLMASMNFMPESKNFVPDVLYTIDTRLNWFAGLVDSDGSVSDKTITIWSVDREFLLNVKLMLNTLGVSGNISLGKKAGYNLLPNGQNGMSVYECQDCWRITISGSFISKLKQLGFTTNRVNIEADPQRNASRFIQLTFKQKRQNLEPEVYCFTEEKNHSGIFNGIMTAQCGEQPLPAYGCCDLGPIILTKFVKDPFTANPYFDFNGLDEAVTTQVRFLDNVLDVTVWPLDKQKQESDSKRRIGVGFTGLGNALAMLNYHYDSDAGRKAAATIAMRMRDTAYRASVSLAKIKGPFPLFNAEKYLEEGTFASRLPGDLLIAINENGIRNSHLLSIAPVGTVSLAFADNASNGIEPPFSLAYKRKKRVSDGNHVEYAVVDHGFRVFLSTLSDEGLADAILEAVCSYKDTFTYNGLTSLVKHFIPSSMVTAMELSVDGHLKMLEVIQPFVDTSISKTVNIPADYPFEDFKQVYEKAHKMKLKGVSTYRPNSILGSVLTLGTEVKPETKETENVKTVQTMVNIDALNTVITKRPEDELESVTKKVRYISSSGDESFYVTVSFIEIDGLIDDVASKVLRPIEVFLTAYPDGVPGEWIDVHGRSLSLLARAGLKMFCKSLQDNRKVKSDKGRVRSGWFTKPDGTKVPRYHESDVACIAYSIQEILFNKGITNEVGDPNTFKFISGYTKPVTEVAEQPAVATEPNNIMPGKQCKECGAHAVVKRDGCDFCTNCSVMGVCG